MAQPNPREQRAGSPAWPSPAAGRARPAPNLGRRRHRRFRLARSRTPGRQFRLPPPRKGGHGGDEPARARDVRLAAFRRTVDRRNRPDRGHRQQCRQAAHIPCGPKAAPRAQASLERSVRHLNDDDLVLHFYGEDGPEMVAVERHLESCAQCTDAYAALTRTLNVVTPPETVEAPDDGLELQQLLRESSRSRSSRAGAGMASWHAEAGALALVWLVPVLYPLSLPAVYTSGQWAHDHVAAAALLVLTVLWACAGPLVAIGTLHGIADSFNRASTRLRALGALMAVISPPLFLLVSRLGPGLWPWYGAISLGAVVALFPWPETAPSTLRLVFVHRLSAMLLGVFLLGHVINQAIAFFSVPSYAAMRSVMRLASQHRLSYVVILSAVAIQMVTGAAMGMKRVQAGAVARNLQAVSGWYLAVFLLSHVFSGFLFSPPPNVIRVATTPGPLNLLASASATAQLPYYLLGVAAFLFHVGVYARLAALAYLAEASVRRLSYAAVLLATTIVVTIGLSLCGVQLIR